MNGLLNSPLILQIWLSVHVQLRQPYLCVLMEEEKGKKNEFLIAAGFKLILLFPAFAAATFIY